MTMSATETVLGAKRQLKLLTFLIALLTATAMFIPSIITGQGYFIFYGDFNVQQIPFYQHCHELIRSGSIGWDWLTDLGSDFISSYSFYLLGSPFFWVTLLFPNSFVPYLMGPLLILKFALAALTAYMYIRRFTARAQSAMLGGILYAFSGFSVYNIFFNHFHEAIIFFPLLLLAIEVFMAEKRRGLIIIAVFICALTNYYFFFGMVVFTVIYWIIRMTSKSFKFRISEFFLMLFECVLGLLLAAAILLPSIVAVLQNDRLSSVMTGWGSIMYGKEQIFLNIIECFFFPPDLPARPVFFPGAEVKWSSLGGWLPLFGMTGVVTYLMSQKKGNWLRRLLVTCIIFALIPWLNSAFSLFNTSYYARWFYMPILMMSLATAISIEDTEVDWQASWRWCLWITLAFTAVIGFFPKGMEDGKITGYGLYTDAATNPFKYIYQSIHHLINSSYEVDGDFYDLRFWLTCFIAIASLLVIRAMLPAIKNRNPAIIKSAIAFVCVISVAYSSFFLVSGQSHSYEIEEVMIEDLIEGNVDLDIAEDEFARIDVLDGVDNTGLYLGYSSINFFHSVVSSGIHDFYEFVEIDRSVASRPDIEYASLRNLLSVKYIIDPEIDNSKEFIDESGNTKMSGYTFVKTENDYNVYLNNYYIPIGFTYDYYMTKEQAKTITIGKNRASAMLKAMVVDAEDVGKFSRFMTNLETDYSVSSYSPDRQPLNFDSATLKMDCNNRKTTSCYSFNYNSNGFTAKINLEKANYVFFSIPYSDGWKAFVNGKEVSVEKANLGFMAVAAEEGENTIRFVYETPGLSIGLIITTLSAAITLMYLVVVILVRRKHTPEPPEYPEGDAIATRGALYEAAVYIYENPEEDNLYDDIEIGNINAYLGFRGGFEIDDSALDDVLNNNQEPTETSEDDEN